MANNNKNEEFNIDFGNEDGLEKAFGEEEKKEEDIDELVATDTRVRYLKNIGLPTKFKIESQKAIQWFKEDGVSVFLQTLSDPNDIEDRKKMREYAVTFGENEKVWLYFYNGEFKRPKRTFVGDSFPVLSYPHIINFPIGTNKRDERKYTLLVNQVMKIDRSSDADYILENFKYVVETDKDGNFNRDGNEYLKLLKQHPEKLSDTKRVDWGSIENVPLNRVPLHSDAKPVTLVAADGEDANDIKNS